MADEKSSLERLQDEIESSNHGRAEFLKDKSPVEVLTWIMRCGDTPADIRTRAAIALLPHFPAPDEGGE